ncbi:hypothetical protein KI387_039526, partial [Taxus chinensis]
LVTNQVSEVYETRAEHLQLYKTVMLDLTKGFDFISIEVVPHEQNLLVDSIVTSTSRFTPSNDLEDTNFTVSLHTESLIRKVPVVSMLTYVEAEGQFESSDPIDGD